MKFKTYAVYATIGNLPRDLDQDEKPDVNVWNGLQTLIPLNFSRFSTGHVRLNTFNGFILVFSTQKPRLFRLIREKEEDADRPRHCRGTEYEKYSLEIVRRLRLLPNLKDVVPSRAQ